MGNYEAVVLMFSRNRQMEPVIVAHKKSGPLRLTVWNLSKVIQIRGFLIKVNFLQCQIPELVQDNGTDLAHTVKQYIRGIIGSLLH